MSNRRLTRLPRIAAFLAVFSLPGSTATAAGLALDTAGKPIVLEAPPPAGRAVCSFRRAICVHGGQDGDALAALAALERAWEAAVTIGLPMPAAYDAYLEASPSRSALQSRDDLSNLDQAHTFSILDARIPAGCSRDFDAARELYAASALTVSPAIDDGSLRAEATALAHLAVPCEPVDYGAFQASPDRAIVDAHVAPGYDEGASLYFSWLDDTFAKQPGGVLVASLALAATRTPGDAHWIAEPDVFDVLRASLKDAMSPGSTDGDALFDFAVARGVAFEPSARLDWDVPWPKTARRLASPEGIAPTGAAYVRIDAKGHPAGARFDLDADWEQLARIRWMILKLDASGRELGRMEATAAPKATHAHIQVVDLDATSTILVVAANVGAWDKPFDPDDEVFEPHGWLLTISSESP